MDQSDTSRLEGQMEDWRNKLPDRDALGLMGKMKNHRNTLLNWKDMLGTQGIHQNEERNRLLDLRYYCNNLWTRGTIKGPEE